MLKLSMVVLWPSFIAAMLAEGLFFSVFDPGQLPRAGLMSPMAVYTAGFFGFWSLGALASMLTCYLVAVPGDHNPRI
ncbi:hypothetical protein HHL21_07595 [Massilia sp. RP-1-19]|uniref:Transmembrane protein n=2 Tax=Massilia polaris TaxID=2728846 RepID=A0A848HQS1_9BURK|nr:hypothetical protein [Massilia polaris]